MALAGSDVVTLVCKQCNQEFKGIYEDLCCKCALGNLEPRPMPSVRKAGRLGRPRKNGLVTGP